MVIVRHLGLLSRCLRHHLHSHIDRHRSSLPSPILIKYIRSVVLLGQGSEKDKKMKEKFLFMKHNNPANNIDHSDVSNCLTSSFKKAKVFDNDERDDRVSCTRIRSSVCTELAGMLFVLFYQCGIIVRVR